MLLVVVITGLLIAIALQQCIEHWINRITKLPEPPPKVQVKFFGGPLDGQEREIDDSLPEFYTPYIPDEDERQAAGRTELPDGSSVIFYEPRYAVYQAIGSEGDYFLIDQDLTIEQLKERVETQKNG